MTETIAHHRFRIESSQRTRPAFAVQASLTRPWTVLFGPSGSGKTTILRALAGLQPHLSVTLERGVAATGTWTALNSLPAERRQLAYDPQQAPLLPHLSVAENIRFPEAVRRITTRQSQLPMLAELLHLTPLLRKRPHELSGGERQRASLARALAVPDARLLLLDEPFAGLDRMLRDELLPQLQAHLAARSLPVLSVTHDPDEVLLLGADVLRLHEGRLIAAGLASVVLRDEIDRLARIVFLNGSPGGTGPS